MKHLSSLEIGQLLYRVNSDVSVATAAGMTSSARSSGTPKDWAKGSVDPNSSEMQRLVVLNEVIEILTKTSSLKDARKWLDTQRIHFTVGRQERDLSVFEAIGEGHFEVVRIAALTRVQRR